jgi:phospholipid/cholesterol/gamma-HCH transport system ATP-binding protein
MVPAATATATAPEAVIVLDKVSTRFGSMWCTATSTLEVRQKEIFAVIGGSGSGKSTLLREMILLQRPDAGSMRVLGIDLLTSRTTRPWRCASAGA